MSDEEFLIVQAWVNEILTLPEKTIDTARQSRSTMNGTTSQLHKGGSTNKTSDQRPVVLLNCGYQLLNHIINERLKRIVEQTNVLEPGFDTGVAQGSITSPQLFNIFNNALLQMLMATWQNQGISHGLQIGKDVDDSNQDADHGYKFNNIGFIDDISIFAETPEGMQTLLTQTTPLIEAR